jgi:hypothetical protein
MPKVSVPKPHLPKPHVPKVSVPKPHLPKPHVPRVSVPRPHLPRVSVPRPSIPRPSLPRPHLPRPRLPRLPRPRFPSLPGELAAPTAKVALALALTTAAAAGIGSLIGLPLPGGKTGEATGNTASLAPGLIGSGTAPLSPDGPFFPVMGPVDFGEEGAHFGGSRDHVGQDFLTKTGTPLIAVRSGIIIDAGTTNGQYSGGRGNYIYLWSPEDQRTYVYLHMVRPATVGIGDSVVAGQYVGRVGCTGSCDGAHLHFEIRLGYDDLRNDPKPINPLPVVRGWATAPPEVLVGDAGPTARKKKTAAG